MSKEDGKEPVPNSVKDENSEEKVKLEKKPSSIQNNISKETLIQLLKQKNKAIKSNNIKLSKIETRYKKIHKDNRNMKKDRKAFEDLLDLIFNQDEMLFQKEEVGDYSFEDLSQKWKELL